MTRIAADDYLVVTSAGSQVRDLAFLREAVAPGEHCSITDLTAGLPMLALMGPNSRALLQRLTGEPLDNEHFPFATSRELEIGCAIVRASRITYVGELGWELYVPADQALQVYERLGRFGLARHRAAQAQTLVPGAGGRRRSDN